jgi:Ni/Co efflux regulator RcnB
MRKTFTTLLCGALALAFAAGPALAQYERRDSDRRDDRWRQEQRDDHRDDRGRQEQRRDYDRRDYDHRDYDHRSYRQWDYRTGVGPDQRFHRGDRLPWEYRTHHYVVEDWRYHNLTPPPYGYQWVQYGGDYLLVAIATGVIVNALLNN